MIQVRNGIYETNSSSVHAISVYLIPPDRLPERIDLKTGEYGWERRPRFLANYIFTACAEFNRAGELADALARLGVECTMTPTVEEIRKEHEERGYLSYDFGYIDHCDGLKLFIDAILSDDSLLACAMFNGNSVVETGNDNGGGIPRPVEGEHWYNHEKGN